MCADMHIPLVTIMQASGQESGGLSYYRVGSQSHSDKSATS